MCCPCCNVRFGHSTRVARGEWTAFIRCSGTFGVRPCGVCAVGVRCHVPSAVDRLLVPPDRSRARRSDRRAFFCCLCLMLCLVRRSPAPSPTCRSPQPAQPSVRLWFACRPLLVDKLPLARPQLASLALLAPQTSGLDVPCGVPKERQHFQSEQGVTSIGHYHWLRLGTTIAGWHTACRRRRLRCANGNAPHSVAHADLRNLATSINHISQTFVEPSLIIAPMDCYH